MKGYDAQNHPVVGIDLGTTFSAIARWTGETAEIYVPKGEKTMQSVVYFDEKNKKFVYGSTGYFAGVINPENVCIGVKRYMDNKNIHIKLGDRKFTPIDVSAMILQRLYSNIEEMFPEGVYKASGVVVTVPYYFKAHQCENTSEAARKAGLNLIGIIQEPIAAAFAYGLLQTTPKTGREETMLVFDLGGGTFDLTVFRIKETETELNFEVLATDGDDRLGGLDFDKCFMDYIIKAEGINFKEERNEKMVKIGKQKLMEQVIKTKETLSATDTAYMAVLDVIPGTHIDNEYTREDFESSISEYLDKIKLILNRILQKAQISPSRIDRVLKVGGSSKIPIMDEIIEAVVGKGKIYANTSPDLCVAQGAAIYAGYLTNNLKFNKKINIVTTTAHSLGVEDVDGKMVVLVHANQKTPAKRTMNFTTDKDNTTDIDVEVYQGNAEIAKENTHVGTISVTGLIPRPKDELVIKITFEVSREQEVKVTVEQKESGILKTEVLKLA